jgi:tRNA threonylcarbamoyladenosine modification (KEOPS) complex Cgi121 subunit
VCPLLLYEVSFAGASHPVGIFGCRVPASLEAVSFLQLAQQIGLKLGVTFQLVDATKIAGAHHLLFATLHALSAFHTGTQRADDLGLEVLRFAAARRQINRALHLLGLNASTRDVAGVIFGQANATLQRGYATFLEQSHVIDAPKILEFTTRDKMETLVKAYAITNIELAATQISRRLVDQREAIKKLIYDRCALLAITK